MAPILKSKRTKQSNAEGRKGKLRGRLVVLRGVGMRGLEPVAT